MVSWARLPPDVLRHLLLTLHPDERPNASLVCKAWLRCHDDLVTVLADPQPIEVRLALPVWQNVDSATMQQPTPQCIAIAVGQHDACPLARGGSYLVRWSLRAADAAHASRQ